MRIALPKSRFISNTFISRRPEPVITYDHIKGNESENSTVKFKLTPLATLILEESFIIALGAVYYIFCL